MIRAGRIPLDPDAFSRPRARAKHPRELARNHLRFIRGLPCLVPGCRHTDIQAAHIRMASRLHGKLDDAGTGRKPDDKWALPLCRLHHTDGPEAQHRIGEQAFWLRHGIDPFGTALALWACTGDEDRASIAIHEAWKQSGR